MSWQDDPITQPAPQPRPWESDPVVYQAEPPRVAHGLADAVTAGYQGSLAGLADRGRLPDVVLDPQHSTWYEKLVASGTQLFNEMPEMIAGGMAGAAAGSALGPWGAAAGGGAGAFAAPAAIRESLIQAYSKGQVVSSADFLERAKIVLKHTGKEALIGALTGGAGKAAEVVAAPLLGESVMAGKLAAPTARAATEGAKLGAEYGTLVVAPAALEGRLPEPEDFLNTAILLVGLKGAQVAAGRMRQIYAATGKTPMEVMADAKADPTIVEDLAREPNTREMGAPGEAKPADPLAEYGPEIPRAYREAAREETSRNAVPEPSPDAARAFVEKPFAEVPQLPGEPILATHVNYNYLNTTEDVRGALSRLSQLYEQRIVEAKRDTVPWEQTYQEARALFEQSTGQKLPEAPTDANYRALAADVYAQKQLLVAGAEQLMTLRQQYVEARTEGRATDQMKLDLLAQIERVATAQAAARGAQAEVGRALNILKSTNRDKAYYDDLNRLISDRFAVEGKLGDANFDRMVDMMGDLGSPREALEFAKRAAGASTWDKVIEAWKAGLVSGPWTQAANILGNATFMATRPLIDLTASTLGMFRSGADRVTAVEPLARVVGNIQGVVDASKVAFNVLRTGDHPANKLEVAHRKAIEGVKGEVIRAPFRLLSAADAFFRVLNERGEAYSLAVREATGEGFNPATREFRERVQELATNPTLKMQDAIEAAGERFTFNMPLGDKGQAIQSTIRKLHLEWAVPFVQTPANVAKELLRMTPLAPVIGEWREAIAAGGAARDKAMAELAAGTAVGTAVFAMAISGHISGQGDPDPKKRAVAMAAGWQPYSIKVGDTWYSYQRLQPVGTLFGMASDMAEVWEHMTPEESDKTPKILATAFANAITNQTFLQGITQLVNAISDPGRFLPKLLQNMAGSVVPALVGQTAQMMDPYQREVDSVKDAVQARIPGLRTELFPKRDPFGDPVPAKDRMGEITPVTASTESDDKVRKEAKRLQIGVAKAPDHIELPAGHDKKLGKVDLSPEQQDIFATEAGKLAYHVLNQLVHQPTWDNMPDMAQANAMNLVFEHARKAGKAAAVGPEQLARETDRIANTLRDRMAQGK